MKPLFIIQARMSSNRLPGKVLKKINNKTLIDRIIHSAKNSKYVSEIYVATSTDSSDDILVKQLENADVKIFRGSLNDVFSRFYEIAKKEETKYDSIVRLTADCPLLDPKIIDRTLEAHYSNTKHDYTSTGISSTFPLGQGVEIIDIDTFLDLKNKKLDSEDREHVTRYIWKRPEIYNCKSITYQHPKYKDCSNLRITVDQIEDFILVEKIIKNMNYDSKDISLDEIVSFLFENPNLIEINKYVKQVVT